jgi:hypothetical protein
MKARKPAEATKLEHIPGIGPSLAQDLRRLGIQKPIDLKGKNPEKLYQKLETITGGHQDRCVLYTFRCAVYFMSTPDPTPAQSLWWNWKDHAR